MEFFIVAFVRQTTLRTKPDAVAAPQHSLRVQGCLVSFRN